MHVYIVPDSIRAKPTHHLNPFETVNKIRNTYQIEVKESSDLSAVIFDRENAVTSIVIDITLPLHLQSAQLEECLFLIERHNK